MAVDELACDVHKELEVLGGQTALVEWTYPDRPLTLPIEVGLCCVRAADSIQLRYDFERDGYVVYQASRFEFEEDGPHDPDWQEVAFVPAWGRQVESERGQG